MLLLDEPTNHLDAESVAWLERHLAEFPGTVVAVTHDRYFLDNVAGWILELDRGHGIPYEGNYTAWLDQKRTRLAQEEKQASARQRTLGFSTIARDHPASFSHSASSSIDFRTTSDFCLVHVTTRGIEEQGFMPTIMT